MKLSEYPRPTNDTGLGIHASAGVSFPLGEVADDYHLWFEQMDQMGIRYLKLLTNAGDYPSALEPARMAIQRGMMPIIRPYRNQPCPFSLFERQPEFEAAIKKFIDAGVRYIETDKNEPNLLDEWLGGWGTSDSDPTEWKKGAQPDRVAEAWAKDAEVIIRLGGLPGLPPMAPGGNYNDIDFFRTMLNWLKLHGYSDLMTKGVWISVHNATFNHPLDYPYDDVNQNGTPVSQSEYDAHQWHGSRDYVNAERQRGKNPGQHLLSVDANGKDVGASNCWRKFEALERIFEQTFGFQVPVLSTEGGIWPGPQNSPDPRYPINSLVDVASVTVRFSQEMMRGEYPSYYFCTCPWLMANRGMGNKYEAFEEQAWYSYIRQDGQQPVVQAMKNMPKQVRPVSAAPAPTGDPPVLSDVAIAQLCYNVGFRDKELVTAVAIVLAESGGNPQAVNTIGNTPPSRDRGLWQINDVWHPEVTDEQAFDPVWSTRWAYQETRYSSFELWTSFTTGSYLSKMPRAEAAANQVLSQTEPDEETLINVAWNARGIAYNPTYAFPRYAKAHGLGVPMSPESKFVFGGIEYTCQLFHQDEYVLIYCKTGDWENIKEKVIE